MPNFGEGSELEEAGPDIRTYQPVETYTQVLCILCHYATSLIQRNDATLRHWDFPGGVFICNHVFAPPSKPQPEQCVCHLQLKSKVVYPGCSRAGTFLT